MNSDIWKVEPVEIVPSGALHSPAILNVREISCVSNGMVRSFVAGYTSG